MKAAPPLCLPLLHPETGGHPLSLPPSSGVRHLWPGLPAMSHEFWQPEQLPFSAPEAAACLADFQAMSEAALSGVPLHALTQSQSPARVVKEQEEQELLAHFAATGESVPQGQPDNIHVRKAAQKALIWAWLLEERHREVRDLTRSFQNTSGRIAEALGVDNDEELHDLRHTQMLLASDDLPLPPWRMVVENAAIFLPDDSLIIVNHPAMADFLRENAVLRPLSAPTATELGLTEEAAKIVSAHEARVSLRLFSKSTLMDDVARPWLKKNLRCVVLEEKA